MIKKFFLCTSFLCVCVSCAWADVGINAENFPDDVFREYVRSSYDADSNDILSEAEIARVKHIRVGLFVRPLYGNISSLKGIEHFTALTYLQCNDNQLTKLDVSKNIALTGLLCSYNQLTELDVSKNTALDALHCNHNQLTELDVSNNVSLEVLFCYDNQLIKLDLLRNIALHRTETDILQNVKGLKLTARTDGTYYTDLMNDYGMTATDLVRITAGSVQGYDRGRNKIATYNATSGVVNFSKYPSELYYNYDTGSGELLRVTMRAIPLITTEQPDDAYVGAEYSFKFKVGGCWEHQLGHS
jgi:hypothetical protein